MNTTIWKRLLMAILMGILLPAMGGLLIACGGKGDSGQVETKTTWYTCPMHPQIIRDQPGTCPICGMDLVPVEEDHAEEGSDGGGGGSGAAVPASPERPVVRIDPAVIRNIGVRTEHVARRPLSATLRLDGHVVPAGGKVFSVPARVMGYAEVLHAAASGQAVKKGAPLLELYSPDVVVTLERLIQSSDRGRDESAERTRQRLLNWDVPESFIRRVERTGKVERRFPLLAPSSGIVLRKNVLEGQSVMAGAELYQIADLSEVWVTARAWQSDLAWIRVGSPARIRFRNLPGQVFESAVFFVSPELDPATRTAQIRIKLTNTPALDLRPEMFAEVVLRDSVAEPVLAVPAQSLIRAGGRDVAVVALGGGRFQPREVTTGREAGGWIEILEGVEEGEEIVTSAQFLIDSESNLRAAVQQLRASGAAPAGQGVDHAH